MKINLHTHTNFSDGATSIAVYADKAKIDNHVCLVLSDHDYMMTKESFLKQLEEAEKISKEKGIAIICGLEISLWFEEALLFNKKACLDWLDRRKSFDAGDSLELNRFDYLSCYIKEIVKKYDCALILVHPQLHTEYSKPLFDRGIIPLFDGYEISNGGRMWPQSKIEWMECVMPRAKQYKNYDCHHISGFEGECNETDEYIGTEKELIEWIKK